MSDRLVDDLELVLAGEPFGLSGRELARRAPTLPLFRSASFSFSSFSIRRFNLASFWRNFASVSFSRGNLFGAPFGRPIPASFHVRNIVFLDRT